MTKENINATIVTPANVVVVDGNQATTSQVITTPAAMITISNAGFEPVSVTVRRGQTVAWVNNDSQPHWPASDPHPSHADRPDLDPLGELAPGGTFLYTFIKSGTVRYHDHLMPERTGTVIVE